MKSKQQVASAGFTIVELLVAIAVGAILVTGMSNIVSSYVQVSQRARYLNLANAYVEAKVEAVRNNGYNSLPIGTVNIKNELPTRLPASRTGTVVTTEPMAGIKQVSISVQYTNQGKLIDQKYTTYVGEIGVGQ